MSQKNSQLIKILEKFPDQNPNPVLRFSEQGALMYYNESSKNIVDEWRIKLNEKPDQKILDNFLFLLLLRKSKTFCIKRA